MSSQRVRGTCGKSAAKRHVRPRHTPYQHNAMNDAKKHDERAVFANAYNALRQKRGLFHLSIKMSKLMLP